MFVDKHQVLGFRSGILWEDKRMRNVSEELQRWINQFSESWIILSVWNFDKCS